MGASKGYNLNSKVSDMIKTPGNTEQRVVRYITPREEAVTKCLHSLIHTLSCREGSSCKAYGCLKMKGVVDHTRTCPKKNINFRGCPICTQLMNLCLYHSKICRANFCHVPFCRIMKKKLQTINELYAQKQSIQSMKPMFQFPIPPLHAPVLQQSLLSQTTMNESRDMNEPQPKKRRTGDSESSSSSFSDNYSNNIQAQHSNFNINTLLNAQSPQENISLETIAAMS